MNISDMTFLKMVNTLWTKYFSYTKTYSENITRFDRLLSLPDDDCTVANGKITDRGQSFECNEGFENTKEFLYQRYSCNCVSGKFSCAIGPAECHPSKCYL